MGSGVACGIVAGGRAGRMGRNKALLPFRGQTILGRQLDVLRPLFPRILLGTSDPGPYAAYGLESVPDLLPERCALAGIHALLSAAREGHVFIIACDMPFLNGDLIRALLDRRDGHDAVVPRSDTGLQPLHAVYSGSCLPAIEGCAARGEWKATSFHDAIRADLWPVRDADWPVEGRSPFLNVNTPEELAQI